MADNYLERQRELYEARKAAWEKKKKYQRKPMAKPAPRKDILAGEEQLKSAERKMTDGRTEND